MYNSEVDIPISTDDITVKLSLHVKEEDECGGYWTYKEVELDKWALMDLYEALEKIKENL